MSPLHQVRPTTFRSATTKLAFAIGAVLAMCLPQASVADEMVEYIHGWDGLWGGSFATRQYESGIALANLDLDACKIYTTASSSLQGEAYAMGYVDHEYAYEHHPFINNITFYYSGRGVMADAELAQNRLKIILYVLRFNVDRWDTVSTCTDLNYQERIFVDNIAWQGWGTVRGVLYPGNYRFALRVRAWARSSGGSSTTNFYGQETAYDSFIKVDQIVVSHTHVEAYTRSEDMTPYHTVSDELFFVQDAVDLAYGLDFTAYTGGDQPHILGWEMRLPSFESATSSGGWHAVDVWAHTPADTPIPFGYTDYMWLCYHLEAEPDGEDEVFGIGDMYWQDSSVDKGGARASAPALPDHGWRADQDPETGEWRIKVWNRDSARPLWIRGLCGGESAQTEGIPSCLDYPPEWEHHEFQLAASDSIVLPVSFAKRSGGPFYLRYKILDDAGNVRAVNWGGLGLQGLPAALPDTPPAASTRIEGVAPNPFNPRVAISYVLGRDGHATVGIYDIRGRLVASLVAQEMEAGAHAAIWDGRDERGTAVASGVYFCRIRSGDARDTRAVTLAK